MVEYSVSSCFTYQFLLIVCNTLRYLIPIANPDALNFTTSLREYTSVDATEWSRNVSARSKTKPSEWHKNIDEETGGQQCFGTNINRNFAYHWQGKTY